MKILHVSFSDAAGGAAIAARRLVEAQRGAGIDAEMFVVRKKSADSAVRAPLGPVGLIRVRAARFFCRRLARLFARADRDGLRTLGLIPSGMGRAIRREVADVVHMHWLGNEMMSLAEIASIRRPVVWTCHDMWAFCGAQHYAEHADFAEGYASAQAVDIDRWIFQRKRRAWSRWQPTLILPECLDG